MIRVWHITERPTLNVTQGNYFFNDGLNFELENWAYCKNDDRRFFSETQNGLKPAGQRASPAALYYDRTITYLLGTCRTPRPADLNRYDR